MRHVARIGLYVGIASVVLGLRKVHAAAHSYDFTASARFGWAIFYIGAICLVDLRVRTFPTSSSAGRLRGGHRRERPRSAAIAVSVAQLSLGSELLPRSVVFGAALVVVPLGALSAAAGDDACHVPNARAPGSSSLRRSTTATRSRRSSARHPNGRPRWCRRSRSGRRSPMTRPVSR